MAATYEPITTTTVSSATNSVTISSIPSTYTDLVVIVNGKNSSAAGNWRIRFNSDSGSNYGNVYIANNASGSKEGGQYSNTSSIDLTYPNNTQTVCIINISNYANTNMFKNIINRMSCAGNFTSINAGLWRSTSAINSITLLNDNNYDTGTIISIYGIKAA